MILNALRVTILACFIVFISCSYLAAQELNRPNDQAKLQSTITSNNQQGVVFTENLGQVIDDRGYARPDILFTASSRGASIYLSKTGIHYQFKRVCYPEGFEKDESLVKDAALQQKLRKEIKTDIHRFTVGLAGANLNPVVRTEGKSNFFENFYLPQCPLGLTNVSSFNTVVFKDVYPNIDWIIYGNEGGIKYDFLVHPGGNPQDIKLHIRDADQFFITEQGGLAIKTSLGEVHEQAPVSFSDGKKIPTQFEKLADGLIGFRVAYTAGHELRIDPSVTWATYYGGSSNDRAHNCAADGSANVYLAGGTLGSTTLASAGGFQTTLGGGTTDMFLAKFDSTGTRLWATYYGGSAHEIAHSLAVDALGNVYMAGVTGSANVIATTGSFQSSMSGGSIGNAFLVKFNPAGIRQWGTYYGGQFFNGSFYAGGTSEIGSSCAVDQSGNVYMTGWTSSNSFIASGGHQNSYGGVEDAFLVKFNPAGSRLWATYYGGSDYERGTSCATDKSGNIFVTGFTHSTSGIASGGFQNTGWKERSN